MASASTKEDQLQLLKDHLQITPKTCRLLYDCGYTTPASLRDSSPNQIIAQFAALPGMDLKSAKVYQRALRRMTLLGATDDIEEAKSIATDCKNWSNKTLKALGAWRDDFDDLTGTEIRERMLAAWSS